MSRREWPDRSAKRSFENKTSTNGPRAQGVGEDMGDRRLRRGRALVRSASSLRSRRGLDPDGRRSLSPRCAWFSVHGRDEGRAYA